MTNLVVNAMVHGFDGRKNGVIRIAAAAGEGETVLLTIADDGVVFTLRLPRVAPGDEKAAPA